MSPSCFYCFSSLLCLYQQLILGNCLSDKHSFCRIKTNRSVLHFLSANKTLERAKHFIFIFSLKPLPMQFLKHIFYHLSWQNVSYGEVTTRICSHDDWKKQCFETEGHSQVISQNFRFPRLKDFKINPLYNFLKHRIFF